MTEPRRLLEQLGPGFERELLVLGGTELAPAAARRRVQASLFGIGAVASVALARPETVVATSSAGAPGATLLAVAAKWLAIGAFAGSAVTSVAVTIPQGPGAASTPRLQVASSHLVLAAAALPRESGAHAEQPRNEQPASKDPARASRRPTGTVLIGKPALR